MAEWVRILSDGIEVDCADYDDYCRSEYPCGGCGRCSIAQASYYGCEILPEYESHVIEMYRLIRRIKNWV